MRQDLPDHHRVLDAGESLPRERSECFGHDLHRPAAGRAGLDVNAKYPFQSLRLYALRVQLMADRRAAGVSSSPSSDALRLAPLPRLPGVIAPRQGLLGANTPLWLLRST